MSCSAGKQDGIALANCILAENRKIHMALGQNTECTVLRDYFKVKGKNLKLLSCSICMDTCELRMQLEQ